jgi:hypothetical protein
MFRLASLQMRLDSSLPGVDASLYARSRVARISRNLVRAAIMIKIIEPVLVFGIIAGLGILAAVHPVAAQGTGLFPGDDQQIGNGVREAIKWARNLLFLLGFVGIGWMIFNLMTEKAWGRQLLGGILCWGFGGLAALAYSFSQGSAVDLPTE